MADKKLQKATQLAEEFLKSEAGKQAMKPAPKATAPKENWVQKLKKKVKGVFASAKRKVVIDPNKENLGEKNVHNQARAGNALTEEEYRKISRR